jgi:hypothetical protein
LSPFLVTSSVWDVFLKKWKPIQGERHLVWVATPILTRYFDDPKISLESTKKGRNVSELKNLKISSSLLIGTQNNNEK